MLHFRFSRARTIRLKGGLYESGHASVPERLDLSSSFCDSQFLGEQACAGTVHDHMSFRNVRHAGLDDFRFRPRTETIQLLVYSENHSSPRTGAGCERTISFLLSGNHRPISQTILSLRRVRRCWNRLRFVTSNQLDVHPLQVGVGEVFSVGRNRAAVHRIFRRVVRELCQLHLRQTW